MKNEFKISSDESAQQVIADQLSICVNYNRAEKRKIAKMAYREIADVIKRLEKITGHEIYCHWNELIIVNGESFRYFELRDNNE